MKKIFKFSGYIFIGFAGLVILTIFFVDSFSESVPSLEENKFLASVEKLNTDESAYLEKKESSDFTIHQTSESTEVVEIEKSLSQSEEMRDKYLVVKVVDGDTLTVSKDGKNITLRLIGIDTPETVHPSKPVECFGIQASNKAKSLLSGKYVTLETDETQGEFDKYQRMLAYVYLSDGTMFNEYMISEGYAYEYTYSDPYKYQSDFKSSQKSAQENKKGLWAEGMCEEVSVDMPASSFQISSQINLNVVEYSCSSNVYNCTDFSKQDEAQNVFDLCGGTVNDIHKLDSDGDGKVCESLP